jgi:hypothetical protein
LRSGDGERTLFNLLTPPLCEEKRSRQQKARSVAGFLYGVKSFCSFNLRSILRAFREKHVADTKKPGVGRNAVQLSECGPL